MTSAAELGFSAAWRIVRTLPAGATWPLFAGAAALAMAVMVLVSVGCALYPAWRATRISPTEALHYE